MRNVTLKICKKLYRSAIILTIVLIMAFLCQTSEAENLKLPLWEAGMGVAPLSMPAYRGSENQEFYLVPMPYIIYRGDFLKVDREGIRGLLYNSPEFSVDISADGAIPASSDKGDAREGMPDIDPVGEIGPSINYQLYENARARLRLRLPVRAAFASDFTFLDHVGWKAHPQINLDFINAAGTWNLGLTLGPVFADRRYHSYYYEVKPAYATETRHEWKASGGYSGTSLLLSASRRFASTWIGLFFRYDNLAGAAFEDSPLVETRHSFMGGMGVAWIIGKSTQSVSVEP
jgi:outer membrane scaffolding protein for murein synthesis (MipA/OmpV family)